MSMQSQTVLQDIESANRFQFNDLQWTSTHYTHEFIHRANDLCYRLIPSFVCDSQICRDNLIRAKNTEIKYLLAIHNAKLRKAMLVHVEILRQLRGIREEIASSGTDLDHLSLRSRLIVDNEGWLQKYTVKVFDSEMSKGPRSLLNFDKYNVVAAAELSADTLLATAFRELENLCTILSILRTLKTDAKTLLASNEQFSSINDLCDRCDEAISLPLGRLYLKHKKWEASFKASKLLKLKVAKIQGMLLTKQRTDRMIQDNIADGTDDTELETDVSSYAEKTFARLISGELGSKNSNTKSFWANSLRKIFAYLNRRTPDVDIFLARELVNTDNVQRAISLYKSARKDKIRDELDVASIAQPTYLIACAYEQVNQFAKSEKWFLKTVEMGVRIDSQDFNVRKAYDGLGYLLALTQQFEKAEKWLKQWEEDDPRIGYKIAFRYAHLYLRWQKFNLSESYLRKCALLKPTKPNYRTEFALLYIQLEKFSDAEQYLHTIIYNRDSSFFTRGTGYMYLGRVRQLQQRYGEAVRWLKRTETYNKAWLQSDWIDARVNGYLGVVYYDIGDYLEAEKRLKLALDSFYEKGFPGHVYTLMIYCYLARVNIGKNEIEMAEEWVDKATNIGVSIADHMDSAAAFQCKALVLIRKGDLTGAVEWLEKAIRIQSSLVPSHSDTAATYFTFGLVNAHTQDLSIAETYFNQALSLQLARNPPSLQAADSYIALADVSEQRGDTHSAVRNLECAIALYSQYCPGHPTCQRLRRRLQLL